MSFIEQLLFANEQQLFMTEQNGYRQQNHRSGLILNIISGKKIRETEL